MRNIITLVPQSRINDYFISSDRINGQPGTKTVKDHRIQGFPNDSAFRFQAEFYEQFACDIVSETVLNYPYPYISEKTLRPIAMKRMFIILGATGTLALLHKKGFATFGDFVDESYDQILNPEDRFLAVVAEIEKLCSTPLNTLKQYLQDIKPRLDQNFDVLQNLREMELKEFSNILDHD